MEPALAELLAGDAPSVAPRLLGMRLSTSVLSSGS